MMFSIEPVGFVSDVDESIQTSVIVVYDEYLDGIKGIEEHKHLIIIYRFHRSHETPLLVHPHGDISQPIVGVFASRSPERPNQLGLTTVELIRRDRDRLFVKGLDALVGSPIIDIKPYSPEFDSPDRPDTPIY